MKYINIIILFISVILSQQVFGQNHSFSIEDVQKHTIYEGKFQILPANIEDFRLIRVNNSAFSKKELKHFNKLKKSYLANLIKLKSKSNLPNEISFENSTYSKVSEHKESAIYEKVNNNNFLVQHIEVYFMHKKLEKAIFKRYNLHSNRQEDSYIIRFFSYD